MKKRLKNVAGWLATAPPWAQRLALKLMAAALLASCPFWPWAPAQAVCMGIARELGDVAVDFSPDGGAP